jgi:hypothetical protein
MDLSTMVIQQQSEDFLSLYISLGPPNHVNSRIVWRLHFGHICLSHVHFYYKPAIESVSGYKWPHEAHKPYCFSFQKQVTIKLLVQIDGKQIDEMVYQDHRKQTFGTARKYYILWCTSKPCQCRRNSPAVSFYRSHYKNTGVNLWAIVDAKRDPHG